VTWAIRSAPARPIEGIILIPRFTSPVSAFRSAERFIRSARFTRPTKLTLGRPTKLTLGAAAVTAVAASGIAAGFSATSGPAVNNAAAVNRAVTRVAPHADAPVKGKVSLNKNAAAKKNAAAGHAGQANGSHAAAVADRTKRRNHAASGLQVLLKTNKNYQMYDSVTPSAIPAHQVAAGYATGTYAASPSQFAGQRKVLWIDTIGSDPKASALDVEPGDATPGIAASWAQARLAHDPHAIARIYTMMSEWPSVQAAIHTLPSSMQARVRYWIADPTGVPHVVPGSDATQWYWGSGYDISTVTPRF